MRERERVRCPRRSSVSGAGVVALLAALAGCQPPPIYLQDTPEPTPITFKGDHIYVGVEPGLPVCGKSFAYLDRFASQYIAHSRHGPLPEEARFFYVSQELFDSEALCRNAEACTRFGHSYSTELTHTHELVHALRQLQGGPRGMAFFEEGIAQLYRGVPFQWADDFEVGDALNYIDERPPRELYDHGGHLLSLVAANYGADKVEELVDATADVSTHEDLSDAVVLVLGVSLDELDEAYANYPMCSSAAWAELLVACNAEPLPWNTEPWSSRRWINEGGLEFGCDHPDAVGPQDARVWRYYTVDVTEPAPYELTLRERYGMALDIVRCGAGCGEDVDFATQASDLTQDLELEPGRYVVRASRALGDAGPIGFWLELPAEE